MINIAYFLCAFISYLPDVVFIRMNELGNAILTGKYLIRFFRGFFADFMLQIGNLKVFTERNDSKCLNFFFIPESHTRRNVLLGVCLGADSLKNESFR